MVYMKGVPDAPQCGFSAMVVRILDEYGTVFHTWQLDNLKTQADITMCTVLNRLEASGLASL